MSQGRIQARAQVKAEIKTQAKTPNPLDDRLKVALIQSSEF